MLIAGQDQVVKKCGCIESFVESGLSELNRAYALPFDGRFWRQGQ